MSFARRRNSSARPGTPDLASLLSRAAARQSASTTARVLTRIDGARANIDHRDPRVDLFAEATAAGHEAGIASFSNYYPESDGGEAS